jgi:DNA-binding transcriptional regulator PaaX
MGNKTEVGDMTKIERRIMDVIVALGGCTYAVPLHGKLNEGRWYSNSPLLSLVFGVGFGSLYAALYRLERDGLLCSEWGRTRYPERGGARRRYYTISDKGTEALTKYRN